MTTAAEAIREAMVALGGDAAISDVTAWIESRYPRKWRPSTISTSMADLAYRGSQSSPYPSSRRFLVNVGWGHYRLR